MKALNKGSRVLHEEGLTVFIRKSCLYVLQSSLVPLIATCRFKRLVSTINEQIDEAIDFAFSFRQFNMSIIPWQIRKEIAELLRLIQERRPRVVLEIGTADGGTLFLFCRFSDLNGKIISIDLPSGYRRWNIPLLQSFARGKQKICLIRADSHVPETLEKVKRVLNDKRVDFLFIDGDHSYDSVKKDFEIFSQLVKEGGIIAFHDIAALPPSEVSKFWSEIKNNYKFVEILDKNAPIPAGIGVLYV